MTHRLLDYLVEFITPERNAAFERVLKNRTQYITVALEDIYQSHNASAVLRSCDCFGIQDVHIIENKNEYILDTEVTMGSDKWLRLHKYTEQTNNTLAAISSLKEQGYRIIATTPHTHDTLLPDYPVEQGKMAVFLGTELNGLSKDVLNNADDFLKIPMYGFTESFNISVSAALILQNLVHRLHNSQVNWKLSQEEKDSIKLEWLRKSIKKVSMIEDKFREQSK